MEMDGNEIRQRSLQRPGIARVMRERESEEEGREGKKRNFGRIGSDERWSERNRFGDRTVRFSSTIRICIKSRTRSIKER